MTDDKKTVLVTGASGLVGRALCVALEERGHVARRLGRGTGHGKWDPLRGEVDEAVFDDVDSVVHLAGEPIAQRWTGQVKNRILRSRVDGTALLARTLLDRDSPASFICASGINFYGTVTEGKVDESSPRGAGFLAEVCEAWEGATAPFAEAGRRVALVRTGVVLSPEGGALAKLLTPFRMGVGGRVGDGSQWMSWISLPDLVAIYLRLIESDDLSGPVNGVAPEAVTNGVFAEVLGKVLGRPTVLPVPEFMMRALFGEMGEETVLADIRVEPAALSRVGFVWETAGIEAALRACL